MYKKKPEKNLVPIGNVDITTLSRVRSHISNLKSDVHRSANVQLLIDKWEVRLIKLEKNFTQAERLAELANTIDSYKFKNNYDDIY